MLLDPHHHDFEDDVSLKRRTSFSIRGKRICFSDDFGGSVILVNEYF
jgi:hypothetical protein